MSSGAQVEPFSCGHPREPDNSWTAPGGSGTRCNVCARARWICRAVVRDQARINAGEILAPRGGGRSRYQHV